MTTWNAIRVPRVRNVVCVLVNLFSLRSRKNTTYRCIFVTYYLLQDLFTISASVRKNDIVAHVGGAAGADVRVRRGAPAPERILGALGS